TVATSVFTLDAPVTGITGIRIIGSEGGTSSAGFIGVFEIVLNLSGGIDVITDTDGDRLADQAEVGIHGTDPANPDTDEDGYWDWIEIVGGGTDPLNAEDFPANVA